MNDAGPIYESLFVQRCVRSWVAAEASVRAFLAQWSPQAVVPLATPPRPRRRARRHGAASAAVFASRRAPYHPTPLGLGRGDAPLDGVGPNSLWRRFPYVAALLVELAALERPQKRRARQR